MTEQSLNTHQEDSCRSNRGGGGMRQEERDYHSDIENMAEERQRNQRTVSESAQEQERRGRRKPALVRSKTFDHSLLTQAQPDAETKMDRKKSHYSQLSKTNSQYHKIFKELSKEEQLRQSYTCALQKDILYQGRMFVSDHWICFHSKVFGKDTKIAIPVVSVVQIKKTKTAILVPNALVVATANDRYMFVSLLSRDNTYKFLMSICLHLEEKSPCSSPVLPPAECGLRGQRSPPPPPRFPLSFSGEFVDLDGSERQRSHDTEESSSSDSQITEFPVPPFLDALKHTDRAATPDQDQNQDQNKDQNRDQDQDQSPSQKQSQSQKQQKCEKKPEQSPPAGSEPRNHRNLKSLTLNTLMLIYLGLVCVLVLSSCYLAFKIISLEQTLTTIGSEFTQHRDSDLQGGADVFSELLTINLMKLEKVQRNLQRLLDEAA